MCTASSFNVNMTVHRVDGVPEKHLVYFTTETFVVTTIHHNRDESYVRMSCRARKAPLGYKDITSLCLNADVVSNHFEILPSGAAVAGAIEFDHSRDHIGLNRLIKAAVPLQLARHCDNRTDNVLRDLYIICALLETNS